MSFSDETLMAFADGELDDITSHEVELAMRLDPAIAEKVRLHQALRSRLQPVGRVLEHVARGLAFEPALFRAEGGLGGLARLGHRQDSGHQRGERLRVIVYSLSAGLCFGHGWCLRCGFSLRQ